MSLDQLNYFITVAEEKNITRAAKKLRLSQPPLTRQLRSLEYELGTPLFKRLPRGVALLPSGERLLVRARRIFAELDAARAEAQLPVSPSTPHY